ncbi:unnamed protein product [Rhizoctonia solani]|uniref:Uncharacterized protein n=1 Tax=Rhizoctonia solani TaxID=456999 RepID=A0A8H3GJD3_9AGAM|nr:unnamed protein product [Rhizoctonia solani]
MMPCVLGLPVPDKPIDVNAPQATQKRRTGAEDTSPDNAPKSPPKHQQKKKKTKNKLGLDDTIADFGNRSIILFVDLPVYPSPTKKKPCRNKTAPKITPNTDVNIDLQPSSTMPKTTAHLANAKSKPCKYTKGDLPVDNVDQSQVNQVENRGKVSAWKKTLLALAAQVCMQENNKATKKEAKVQQKERAQKVTVQESPQATASYLESLNALNTVTDNNIKVLSPTVQPISSTDLECVQKHEANKLIAQCAA